MTANSSEIITTQIIAIRKLEASGQLSPSSADDAIRHLEKVEQQLQTFIQNNPPIQSSTTSPTRG